MTVSLPSSVSTTRSVVSLSSPGLGQKVSVTETDLPGSTAFFMSGLVLIVKSGLPALLSSMLVSFRGLLPVL